MYVVFVSDYYGPVPNTPSANLILKPVVYKFCVFLVHLLVHPILKPKLVHCTKIEVYDASLNLSPSPASKTKANDDATLDENSKWLPVKPFTMSYS